MTRALEVRNLVKRFGGLKATDDISFLVEEGESVGLIGPNGAGKTTVFSQIMGEVRQTSGTIHLFGDEVSGLGTPARIRRGVNRTYQIPRPFAEMSVAENIRVGLMPDSLRQMIFSGPDPVRERALGFSVGLTEADLDRIPQELSMGDLRKLEMARTMATAPRVLLLDEVFAGLTVAEIAQISELIQSMRREGMTFLIVSHDLPALEPLVDRCVAIDCGSLVAQGTFREVVASHAVRESYLGKA